MAAMGVAFGLRHTGSRHKKGCSTTVVGTWVEPATAADQSRAEVLKVPLLWREGAFCLRFGLTSSGAGLATRNEPTTAYYWGVVDTGSPFLLVARCLRRDCPEYCWRWGCYSGEGQPSGLADTVEVYVSGESAVEWQTGAYLSFPDIGMASSSDMLFGVQGNVVSKGGTGSGVYFGLVSARSPDIRPSFLEQTPYTSLSIDLRRPGSERLVLSTSPQIPASEDALELLDLRTFGAPISFYAAVATSLRVGGQELLTDDADGRSSRRRRVLCIFDTGTTGVAMTGELWRSYWGTAKAIARSTGERMYEARRLDVVFDLPSGQELTLDLFRGIHPAYGDGLDLVTEIDEVAWAGLGDPASLASYRLPEGTEGGERPFDDVAFLGLSFLVGRNMRIDASSMRLALSPRGDSCKEFGYASCL